MTSELLQQWHDKGQRLDVPGTAGTRIWRQGEGAAVVCLHGVPSSAYLYRKVLPELASRGFEGIAIDIQGLGFSDRPEDFDYTWTGLSGWLEQALAAAGIEDFPGEDRDRHLARGHGPEVRQRSAIRTTSVPPSSVLSESDLSSASSSRGVSPPCLE
jgi:hypothetical protein